MPCTYRLSTVILELAIRAGMDPERMDVGLLDREVRGLTITNGYPVAGALLELSRVFYFDPSNHSGKLHFLPRGENAVATISEDDLVDDQVELEQQTRADSLSVPRVLNLNYHDVAGGLATDKQTSERPGDRRAVGETQLQSAVTLNADEAKRVVTIAHAVLIEDQRGEVRFALPDSYLFISPADIIFLQRQTRTERLRIAQASIFDGYLECVAMRDRQSAYTSDVQGIPAAAQTPPPSSLVGPTLIEVLDIPMLRDSHDRLGFYVAVSGVLDAWQGATIEISLDGGANYVDSSTWNVSAIMGELETALGDHPQSYPDEVNVCEIRIDTPFGELLETDLPGLLNRGNLAIIGDELIQFAEADEVSPGRWEIGYLLRGRRGTEAVAHSPGERFVLLEQGVIPFVDANLTDLDRELTFRATSFGSDPESGAIAQITFEGGTQKERKAAYLQARIDTDDLLVSWMGVGRLGAGANAAQGVHFEGYKVTMTDGGANTVETETTAQSLQQDVSGWGSPITVTVVQVNSIVGDGPEIEVTV